MSHAPEWFVNMLNAFDSDLSVRWGNVVGQWVIERKGVIGQSEIAFLRRRMERAGRYASSPPPKAKPADVQKHYKTWQGTSEELDAALRGKRIILFTHTLSPQLLDALGMADIKRYGGYARFADELEAAEDRKEADAERQLANKRNAYNKEVWGMLDHIWRKHEDSLLNGERDMGKLLHGRRTEPGSAPLIQLSDV